ncbi:cell division protein FtsI [Microbispora sp. RL4-1S]|uniref:Cell division protein FtsI n=1 Tax=Microbispora oryzae TaxID=2806554 RepID=A0A940WFF4_9ACTN|nr:cell division protein FtsI [Microbispora oryzae]
MTTFAEPARPSPTRTLELTVEGSPEETAKAYLRAWADHDFEAMRELVDDPPNDFADQHEQFEDALLSSPLRLTPGETKKTGDDTAEVTFTQTRGEQEAGTWTYDSTLHLAVRDLTWKVLWTPAVLHPDLQEGGTVERTSSADVRAAFVTADGRRFPQDSDADDYLAALPGGGADGTVVSWSIRLINPSQTARELFAFHPRVSDGTKTTIEWPVQAAAARALDGVQGGAAVVAVRSSTGEILAVADRLGSRRAFQATFPPGSTFKTVTAAALLGAGLSPDDTVDCPPTYRIPQHELIRNYQEEGHGTVSLRQAFAYSCNTSFARLAVERLTADTLVAQARTFGFGASLDPGVSATCGSMRPPENPDALAEDSFGQGTVEASPLCMALVAAAVESGQWRQPFLLHGQPGGGDATPLPAGVADGLRSLMRAVTSDGTAAGAGLPDDVAGKTGTAEVGGGRPDHAWFIGYRNDVAFAVFVEGGGTGRAAAVPIAARFLRAL